jgi:hypothetical protein
MDRPARKSAVDPRIHKDSSLKEGLGKVMVSESSWSQRQRRLKAEQPIGRLPQPRDGGDSEEKRPENRRIDRLPDF